MEQTIILPIALGSKVYSVSKKFNSETGQFEQPKVIKITITEVRLFRNGNVRHYISGNRNYLPKNVFTTLEEAKIAAEKIEIFRW